MKYRGYIARVEFDDDALLLHGEVINTRDVITFQATSTTDLIREFQTSVDEYIAFCEEHGREPEKPYSGKFMLRVDPDFHRSIQIAAIRNGQSINTWVVDTLKERINRDITPPRRTARPASKLVQVPMALVTHDLETARIPSISWALSANLPSFSRLSYSFPQSEDRSPDFVDLDLDEESVSGGH